MHCNRFTKISGIIWAFICLLAVPVMFFGFPKWEHAMASLPFMKVSEKYTGGAILQTVSHDTYETKLHYPVFPAILGQSHKGFVQINWAPLTNLPSVIHEKIAYPGKTPIDFTVTLDTRTGKAQLEAKTANVNAIQTVCKLEDSWLIRIDLTR